MSYIKKEIVITEDGSPSLVFYTETDKQMMHSFKGAFSETEYIYAPAIEQAKHLKNLNIISVGLGFTYIELSAILRLWQHPDFIITTYESEQDLVDSLLKYLNNEESIYTKEYDIIFKLYESKFLIPTKDIKLKLTELLNNKIWQIKSHFLFQPQDAKLNVILFDPFCSRFHQEMWQAVEIRKWLEENAASACIFSTYAAKGDLNRVLKDLGFQLSKKPGFALKRESTFACRNL